MHCLSFLSDQQRPSPDPATLLHVSDRIRRHCSSRVWTNEVECHLRMLGNKHLVKVLNWEDYIALHQVSEHNIVM